MVDMPSNQSSYTIFIYTKIYVRKSGQMTLAVLVVISPINKYTTNNIF